LKINKWADIFGYQQVRKALSMPPAFASVPKTSAIAKLPTIGNKPVPYTTIYYDEDGTDPTSLVTVDTRSRGVPVDRAALARIGRAMGINREDLATITELPGGSLTGGVALRLECHCVFGVGQPRIGKPCVHRQRKAMRERRCVVCGGKIKDGHLVFLGVDQNIVPDLGPEITTSVQPPAHPACAAYSALTCPRLYSNPAGVQVAMAPNYGLRQNVVGAFVNGKPKSHLAHLDEPITMGAVDLHVAVIPPEVCRLSTLDEWMTKHAPPHYRDLAA
jgi:hypothetical protein